MRGDRSVIILANTVIEVVEPDEDGGSYVTVTSGDVFQVTDSPERIWDFILYANGELEYEDLEDE